MRAVLGLVPRGRAGLAVLLAVLTVLSGAALLAASGALITGAAQRPETLLVLMPLITSVRLFGVARPTLRYAERLVAHDLTLRLLTGLRSELLQRLVPLAPAALSGVRGGDLLARIRSDVDELQGVFVRLVGPSAVAAVAGAVAVALTALVSPATALVLGVLLVVLGVAVPAWAGRAGRSAASATAAAEAAFGADALDLVRGLTDNLSGDGGGGALRRLERHLARQSEAERTTARVLTVTTWLRETVPALGVVAALWLVGTEVSRGTADPVLLAATALGVLGAFEAVAGLGAAWATAEGLRGAASRVEALRDRHPAVSDPPEPAAPPATSTVAWQGVTLQYPDSLRPALQGLELQVGHGEKVALTGPSGAGKSTVLALALRARDPDGGRVLLGGTDLRRVALPEVRRRFAWEPQVPQLLGGTLAGNLRIARPGAAEVELASALQAVELGGLLGTVGLHGWIGEGGERLSAGERARVCIARALLSEADVLLLDEPTAHLDAALAGRVHDLLAHDPRTVVMVSHDAAVLDSRWRVVALRAAT